MPIIHDHEKSEGDMQPVIVRPAARARSWRRLARWTIRLALFLVLVPLLLVPLYSIVPPPSTLMLHDWVLLRRVDRQWAALDAISPHLVRSVMMSEDARFCLHGGIDWEALRLVLKGAGDEGPARGASTIPMQTAKNLFLWNSRSYLRKAIEIPLALYMDFVWSKRRMLEIYLNIAEWGPGLYGAEAAARHYFDKSAAKLSAREAALLAAALPSPLTRDPRKPTSRQRALARIIERRAKQSGAYIACLEE